MPRKSAADLLTPYRAKRTVGRTPEPAGVVAQDSGQLFVIHQHAARRLHYDLRLEMEGVLRSWAVPKGPSYNPSDKRLAVLVEDHPLEYGDFEGRIPEGNYGAGAVIVWDRGRWTPVGDPIEGLAKGKLLFRFDGYKLHGLWTLVKIKKSVKDWLLIKERDAWASPDTQELPAVSVLSGLTVEEVGAKYSPDEVVHRELMRLKAPRKPVDPTSVGVMLAETADAPFSRKDWLFEPKLDGYRLIAARQGTGASMLLARKGNDYAMRFPEVVRAISALPFERIVLDGEVVALDDAGRPSFQRLQGRTRLNRATDIRYASVTTPATYYAFDLLGFNDFDLRTLPLVERKQILQQILPALGPLRYVEHVEKEGEALYHEAERLGFEGVIAKKMMASYRAGRSPLWLKVRVRKTGDFVIVGFTKPKGSRSGFGALYLADYVDDKLVYAGRAGSGFTDRQLDEVSRTLQGHRRRTPPCTGPLPSEKGASWVDPVLVCEVEYSEWTDDAVLRQPVFLRFRDDKRPEECIRMDGPRDPAAPDEPNAGAKPPKGPPRKRGRKDEIAEEVEVVPPTVDLTNLKKVFWPDEGYAKGDLIEYYRTISPWLLPYLRDRPIVLTRYPDGIAGKSFFQKDAPGFIPDWIRTERIWSEERAREIDYFICNDEASLLYVVNLGTIPIHLWSSRAPMLEQPDWCVLDLDPKHAPFAHVIEIAHAARELCQRIKLPVFVKTTGSTGLHLLIPLGRQCTHEQSRTLGELLAMSLVNRLPQIATVARQLAQREGKVYVDYLQNGSGKLIVAPFAVRALPGAPVSVPLTWKEVDRHLEVRAHTIKTVPERMRRLRTDPVVKVLEGAPDLVDVLERLMGEIE